MRAAERQAAPYSRGEPKTAPKRPRRKAGEEYAQHHCRAVPRRADERIAVPLPKQCPDCREPVQWQGIEVQYQEDVVRRTMVRRFDVAVGRCRACGKGVPGRRPLRTSDALGAAEVLGASSPCLKRLVL